jgi:hypothetical protein
MAMRTIRRTPVPDIIKVTSDGISSAHTPAITMVWIQSSHSLQYASFRLILFSAGNHPSVDARNIGFALAGDGGYDRHGLEAIARRKL